MATIDSNALASDPGRFRSRQESNCGCNVARLASSAQGHLLDEASQHVGLKRSSARSTRRARQAGPHRVDAHVQRAEFISGNPN
jgi:hypothetical protein